MKISTSDPSKQTASTEDTLAAQSTLSSAFFYNLILQMQEPLGTVQLPPSQPSQKSPLQALSESPSSTMPLSRSQGDGISALSTPVSSENSKTSLDALEDHPLMSQLNFVQQTLSPNKIENNNASEKTLPVLAVNVLPMESVASETIPLSVPTSPRNANDAVNVTPEKQNMADYLSSVQLSEKLMPVEAPKSKPSLDTALKKISSSSLPISRPSAGIFSTQSQPSPSIEDAIEMLETAEISQAASLKTTHAQPAFEDKSIPSQSQIAMQTFTQLSHFIHSHTLSGGSVLQQTTSSASILHTDSLPVSVQQSSVLPYEPQIDIVASSVGPFLKESYDAKIKIYPPDLGSVLAKLKIDKGSAQLTLLTESNRVKEIVEANLPQLHQQFKDADILLTQVEVQSSMADLTGQTHEEPPHFVPKMSKESSDSPEKQVISSSESPHDPNQIVDTYA